MMFIARHSRRHSTCRILYCALCQFRLGKSNSSSSDQTVAAQQHFNVDDIQDLQLPLRPPLPEQRAIAGALSDVDALIGALDQLIAKKRDLKQAAMQQLLTGQTRLPGFHGEWEVKRLGEVAEDSRRTRLVQELDGTIVCDDIMTSASEISDCQLTDRFAVEHSNEAIAARESY